MLSCKFCFTAFVPIFASKAHECRKQFCTDHGHIQIYLVLKLAAALPEKGPAWSQNLPRDSKVKTKAKAKEHKMKFTAAAACHHFRAPYGISDFNTHCIWAFAHHTLNSTLIKSATTGIVPIDCHCYTVAMFWDRLKVKQHQTNS